MTKATKTHTSSLTKKKPAPGLGRFLGRKARTALGVLGVAVAFSGGWWLWYSGTAGKLANSAKWTAIATTAEVGFRVDEILVVGREQTLRDDLSRAVGLTRGTPILAFDPSAAKARVEALPWVLTASVERALPSTVLVRVQERQPLALWQSKGRLHLIDEGGEIIISGGLERFSDMLLVVGEDAPDHTAALIQTLQTEPQLMTRVTAAVRVGGRRWNLRLDSGVDVRLPEGDPSAAWSRLAEYERSHRVLARDVKVLDLRLPDRLIVRRAGTDQPTAPSGTQGRET